MNGQLRIAELANEIESGIRLLLRACRLAADAQRPEWDFAVEVHELHELGLSNCDLRWLVSKGLASHRTETYGDHSGRSFIDEGELAISRHSCFVLTRKGEAFAASLRSNGHQPRFVDVPDWNARSRELRVGGQIVKKFRVPAANQELILTAFEEESWPYCVNDPLPPVAALNSKRRLHAAIQSLNRNQRVPLIRFRGNGQADGVCWELGDQSHEVDRERSPRNCTLPTDC